MKRAGGQAACVTCGGSIAGMSHRKRCPTCGTLVWQTAYKVPPRNPGDPGTCLRCGYDLAGIGDNAPCPECGTLAGIARLGTLLPLAEDASLRKLRRGAGLLLIATLCLALLPLVAATTGMLFALLLSAAVDSGPGEVIATIVIGLVFFGGNAVVIVSWVRGWVAVASACADPGLGETTRGVRRATAGLGWAAGACGAVILVLALIEAVGVLGEVPPVLPGVVFVVGALAGSAGACTGMLLLRAVLVRTPAKSARRRVNALIWLSPTLFLGVLPMMASATGSGSRITQYFGCVALVAWLWFVFASSLMLLLRKEVRRAAWLRAANPALFGVGGDQDPVTDGP